MRPPAGQEIISGTGARARSGRLNLEIVADPTGEQMGLSSYIGGVAAVCTTSAFVPQIFKIWRQGGRDLSYKMLTLYLTGLVLWLIYGIILRAAAIIWANAITSGLVAVAMVLKAMHPAERRQAETTEG
jgi:MtN3 and saliva related transmembrane protein